MLVGYKFFTSDNCTKGLTEVRFVFTMTQTAGTGGVTF